MPWARKRFFGVVPIRVATAWPRQAPQIEIREDDDVSQDDQREEDAATQWPNHRGRGRRWLIAFLALLLVMQLLRLAQGIWTMSTLGATAGITGIPMILLALMFLRPRTRATDRGLLVRGHLSRERLVPWAELEDITAEGGRWATTVTARLTDGSRFPLPGVQPAEVEDVRTASAHLTGGRSDDGVG